MRVLVVLSTVLLVAAAANVRPKTEDKKYSVRFDNVEVDDVLRNDRLITHYFKCLTIEGHRCSADGQELKRNLPRALKEGCKGCNEKQRKDTEKVIRFMIDNKPAMWAKLEKKYDPTGAYKRKYLLSSGKLKPQG